jgi:hypothetical protein
MNSEDEDLLVSHAEDQPAPTSRVAFPLPTLTPEATSKIASEMHRWGRMTGMFSIILIVISLVVGALPHPSLIVGPGAAVVSPPSPAETAIRSSLLWPGVVLAILAVIGLFGGFGFDYLAGRNR